MEESLEKLIVHLVMGAIAMGLFTYIVISTTDPTTFFMRHYGQDTGLITEALHGANGNVQLRYLSIYPDHLYWFKFTRQALLIGSPQQRDDIFFARIRKQYGMVEGEPPLGVKEALLKSPFVIDFAKDSREITLDGNFTVCSWARDSFEKKDFVLIIDAPEHIHDRLLDIPLTTSLLFDGKVDGISTEDIESFREGLLSSSLEEELMTLGVNIDNVRSILKEENKDLRLYLLSQELGEKKELLLLKISQGGPTITYSPRAKGASCLFSFYLTPDNPSLVEQQGALSDFLVLELRLPNLLDAQAISAARATGLALEAMLR